MVASGSVPLLFAEGISHIPLPGSRQRSLPASGGGDLRLDTAPLLRRAPRRGVGSGRCPTGRRPCWCNQFALCCPPGSLFLCWRHRVFPSPEHDVCCRFPTHRLSVTVLLTSGALLCEHTLWLTHRWALTHAILSFTSRRLVPPKTTGLFFRPLGWGERATTSSLGSGGAL